MVLSAGGNCKLTELDNAVLNRTGRLLYSTSQYKLHMWSYTHLSVIIIAPKHSRSHHVIFYFPKHSTL